MRNSLSFTAFTSSSLRRVRSMVIDSNRANACNWRLRSCHVSARQRLESTIPKHQGWSWSPRRVSRWFSALRGLVFAIHFYSFVLWDIRDIWAEVDQWFRAFAMTESSQVHRPLERKDWHLPHASFDLPTVTQTSIQFRTVKIVSSSA